MELRIGYSDDYLALQDIVPESDELGYEAEDPHFLRATIVFRKPGVSTDVRASFERMDFQQLLVDLQQLHNDLKSTFVFQNIEDNLRVQFEPSDTGAVILTGYVRNAGSSFTVNFELEVDQTFLPPLISQLEVILRS